MTLQDENLAARTFCNQLAQQRGLDPVGHGGNFQDALLIEVPLPWPRGYLIEPGTLPAEVLAVVNVWRRRNAEGHGFPHRPLIVAPDPEYSIAGHRRVALFTRPTGSFAQYEQVEYLVPTDQVGPLVWALFEDRTALPDFEPYHVSTANHLRDLLVCTHGTIDAACARFGFPLYQHLRQFCADNNVRVWRVSHFGGHLFAPTLIDMPHGHYWAYVAAQQGEQIIKRAGPVAALRGHYRGWAGIGHRFLQAAERELWQQHGWSWFDFTKSGEIIGQDDADDPQWAEVRLRYAAPGDASHTAIQMHVEVSHTVETEPSSSRSDTHTYPQYRVTTLTKAVEVSNKS